MNFLDRDDIQRRVEKDLGLDFIEKHRKYVNREIARMVGLTEQTGFQMTTSFYMNFHDLSFRVHEGFVRHRPPWFQFRSRKEYDALIQSIADTRRIEHAVIRAIAQALEGTDFTER